MAKIANIANAVCRVAGMRIRTGTRPVFHRVRDDGVWVLRPWQHECVTRLRAAGARQIIAPTGSGKSFAATTLALLDLLDGRAERTLIVVPQSIIADGFRQPGYVELPDGRTQRWLPGHYLLDTSNTVAQLHRYLTTPCALGRTNLHRMAVCSHQTLVQHYAQYGAGPHYDGLSLVVDEAHHSQHDDEPNRLGGFVTAWIDHDYGPLTLVTATWFRSDQSQIVNVRHKSKFARYTLSFADYLSGLQHLKTIEIRFLAGTPAECVEHCHNEAADENTIIYIQPPRRVRNKETAYNEVYDTLRNNGVHPNRIIDLVTATPRVRAAAKKTLRRSKRQGEWAFARKGTTKPQKTYLIALLMGREGFNLPELQRSIVIGPRQSMLIMEQMLGRLLRDHKNKTRVQFNIVLPYVTGDKVDGELIRKYVKVLLAVLVLGCRMSPPKLPKEDQDTFDDMADDPTEPLQRGLAALAENLPDDPITDPEEYIAAALKGVDLGGVDRASAARVFRALVMTHRQQALLADMPDPCIVEDDFAGLRAWRLLFGHETLSELSRVLRQSPAFTWDAVTDFLMDEVA